MYTSTDLNISFLKIPRLCHAFDNQLAGSSHSNNDELIKLAEISLDLMNRYKSINPSYQSMIDILDSNKISHDYNETWVKSINDSNNELIAEIKRLKFDEDHEFDDNHIKFDKFKQIFIHHFITNDLQLSLYYVNLFNSILQFSSQPNTHDQLAENNYLEFFFYRFVLQVYSQVWFPNNEIDTNDPQKDNSSAWNKAGFSKYSSINDLGYNDTNRRQESIKSFESLMKKVDFYYSKNESLFNSISNDKVPNNGVGGGSDDQLNESSKLGIIKELKFYWLMKWLNVLVLFKQNKIIEFLENFYQLSSQNSNIPNTTPIDVLKDDFEFKSELLTLISLASILTKPFKELTFIDYDYKPPVIIGENLSNDNEYQINQTNQIISELFASGDSFESTIYQAILLPLSEGDPKQAKISFEDETFVKQLNCRIGYLLPQKSSINCTNDFVKFMKLIIDFKFFLLILSITKQISKFNLIKKLGYTFDLNNEIDLTNYESISNNLIILISCLNLGEMGIGYDVAHEFFYNSSNATTAKKSVTLKNDLDDLTQTLESESLANLMKGLLVEKFFA